MTEEIREILDDMKQIPIDESWALNLEDYQCKLLLNYITNLQKENQSLKENNRRKTSRCTERNHRIRARDRIIERRNKKINKLEDYKSRNEKAIESIENCKKTNGDKYTCIIDHNYLLNILQGGDE